jgi:hypothetical protein
LSSIKLTNKQTGIGALDVSIGGQALGHSNTPIIDDDIGWSVRDYGLHKENGIVVFLDALGMKGIWKRSRPIEVINKWNNVVKSFIQALQLNPPNSRYLLRVLSDTIIITIPTELNQYIINWVFDILLQPFIQSIKLQMLLRGTISYGTYYLSNRLIIGEALDDAAYNHDKLNWIGVSPSPSLSNWAKDNMVNVDSDSAIWNRDIPHKQLPYEGLVLNWPKNDSNKQCFSTLENQSRAADSSVQEKYGNTFAFYYNAINSYNP